MITISHALFAFIENGETSEQEANNISIIDSDPLSDNLHISFETSANYPFKSLTIDATIDEEGYVLSGTPKIASEMEEELELLYSKANDSNDWRFIISDKNNSTNETAGTVRIFTLAMIKDAARKSFHRN
jgi:hypothetical protein